MATSTDTRVREAQNANARAAQQFEKLMVGLQSLPPDPDTHIVSANKYWADMLVLGWPYRLECRLTTRADNGHFATKIKLLRPIGHEQYHLCHMTVFDDLGNFALGGHGEHTSTHENIGNSISLAKLLNEWVLVEAEGRS